MIRSVQPGRLLLAVATGGFALLYLLHALSATFPAAGPPWPVVSVVGALGGAVLGFVLLALALGIASPEWAPRAALTLATATFLAACILDAPKLAATPRDPGPWTSAFELLALCGGALILAGLMTREPRLSLGRRSTADRLLLAGRLLFAISLVVFGAQHFLYARFVATLVSPWIPGHLFWAYFVGVAFVAAALAIATGVQMRLASTLLGLMFLLWVVVLHLPRSLAKPHDGNEWTSLFVALALGACAWVLAGGTTDRRSGLAG